jgi:hypothetical protein
MLFSDMLASSFAMVVLLCSCALQFDWFYEIQLTVANTGSTAMVPLKASICKFADCSFSQPLSFVMVALLSWSVSIVH